MGIKGISRGLGKLLARIMRSRLERERAFFQRQRELSRQIEAAPNSMTLYVLRGELNLERGITEQARADFAAAVELARELDWQAGWRLQEQIMRDRALYGLQVAERAL